MLEAEYWAGWERSQHSKEMSLNERLATGRDEAGQVLGRIKQATRTEQKVGDAAFLNGILSSVKERARLLVDLYPKEAKPEATEATDATQRLSDLFGDLFGNHSSATHNN